MQSDTLLKATLMDILAHCFDQGMKLPLMICMMSPNGSVIAIRCVPDREEPVVLAEHNADGRFASPIGALVLDQHGQVLKFVIDRGRVKPEAPIDQSRHQ